MSERTSPLYTRTGDNGETGVPGSPRVSKASGRIEALGTLDELNSLIGVVRAHPGPEEVMNCLREVQRQLFALGAALAAGESSAIGQREIEWLEDHIDAFSAHVPPLTNFILPGGSLAGAHCHVARSVCRRAERRLVQLGQESNVNSGPLAYLNRLSDLLFAAARRLNHWAQQTETEWKEPKT